MNINYVSKCCEAVVIVVNGVDGTSYYKCNNCGKPCDYTKSKTNKHKGIGVKDNSKKRIIAWAKNEIKEYQKLIKILEKK